VATVVAGVRPHASNEVSASGAATFVHSDSLGELFIFVDATVYVPQRRWHRVDVTAERLSLPMRRVPDGHRTVGSLFVLD
jgi:hypothetical protein